MDSKDIKEYRRVMGFTQEELAQKLGVTKRTIINYEKGELIPESKVKLFQHLMANEFTFVKSAKLPPLNEPPPTGYYHPNVTAAAGMDKEMNNDELQRIPINIPGWGKGIDFINVYGDSMYPKFCSGEIIGIKEVEPKFMNFGYAYVVILNDGQVFLKYIKRGKDSDHWILASENEKYEPTEYHLSLIKKIFIIKGVITKTTM